MTTAESDEIGSSERGLTKRGRLLIIIGVAIVLLGVPLAFEAIASIRADDAADAAEVRIRAIAEQVDPSALYRANTFETGDVGAQGHGAVEVDGATIIGLSAAPTEATITYEVSVWGQDRCLVLHRSATEATIVRRGCAR